MSNPHKPWARIDSRLQRQLGHYAYYGMPADTPRAAIHTLIGTPSDTVPEIDYGIRHIPANDPFFSAFPNHLRGIPRQGTISRTKCTSSPRYRTGVQNRTSGRNNRLTAHYLVQRWVRAIKQSLAEQLEISSWTSYEKKKPRR